MPQDPDLEKAVTLQTSTSDPCSSSIRDDKAADNDTSVVDSPRSGSVGASFGSLKPLLTLRTKASTFGRGVLHFIQSPRWMSRESENFPEIVQAIQDYPNGYPKFAAFLESDENFMIYRRFGYLQSRLLLEKQSELSRLETELRNNDWDVSDEDPEKLRTTNGHSPERKSMLASMERRWLEYSTLLTAAQTMTKINKPTPDEWRSVRNWLESANPIRQEEARLIRYKEDLVTLRPGREYAWLDGGVERFLRVFGSRFTRFLFQSKETRLKTQGSGSGVYYTRSRIERFVLLIITLGILVLLIVPIYVLYYLTNGGDVENDSRRDFECIGVLLVFTLTFSACISLFTRARRHEILAASAAYCAVLVVFIGNLQGYQRS